MVGIDICLATYNGEKYICEQIDSILSQTYSNWHLYIRDDGSTDKTVEILNKYYLSYPEKISIISDNLGNLGFIQNFNEILKCTTSDYIAFCDQDDVWYNQKLQTFIDFINKNNSIKSSPSLIYSDYTIFEKNIDYLKSFYKSKAGKEGLIQNSNLIPSIIRSSILGCTIIINNSLKELCGKIPLEYKLGHDIYFLNCANIFGEVYFLPEILLKHRVHDSNTSKITKRNFKYFLKAALNKKLTPIYKNQYAAKVLFERFENKITQNKVVEITEFLEINSKNLFQRIYFAFKYKIVNSPSLNSLIVVLRFVKSNNEV